jgi:hypothetical protein
VAKEGMEGMVEGEAMELPDITGRTLRGILAEPTEALVGMEETEETEGMEEMVVMEPISRST